jgi:hypothetical protein
MYCDGVFVRVSKGPLVSFKRAEWEAVPNEELSLEKMKDMSSFG